MTLSITACLLIAVWYWIINCDLGNLGRALMNPTLNGVFFGLIFGDVVQGTIIGATINIMYISVAAVGANMPADDSLAAVVAIPVALTAGLDPETAVLLATPFGILGTFMDNLRRMVNGYWNRKAHKDAQALNFKGITIDGFFGPMACQFIVRVPITFLIMLSVSQGTNGALEYFPAWVMTGLSTVGGILPGFGLVLCATFIGKKYLLPFFVLGFFVMKMSGISTLVAAIFGIVMAIAYVQLKYANDESEFDMSIFKSKATYDGTLTKKDINGTALRVMLLHRFSNSLEAMYGTGVGWAMTPILRKVYKGQDEQLKEAIDRHMLPYITEMSLGNCIMGAALAMEEEIASGSDEITGDDVVAMKSSLMGPFAGFGDSLVWSTYAPLVRTIFIPLAQGGSVLAGILMEPFIRLSAVIASIWAFRLGYTTGKRSLVALLRGGMMKKLMEGAGVMGMFMLGAMGASYCKLNLALAVNSATLGGAISIQEKLDGILPGLLPFLMMMGVYSYFEKGGKYLRLIIIVLVLSLVGAFFGIV